VRARAITEARDGRADALRLIARRDEHRAVLQGAAIVLRLADARSPFRTKYGRFEGRLSDPDAIADLTRRFAEDRPVLSASQLESLSHCPFQFFLRYASRIEPTEGPGELDADHAVRGSLVHRVLENFHQGLTALDTPTERVLEDMGAVLAEVLDGEPPPVGDVDAGLRRIEALRFHRLVHTYAHQLNEYIHSRPDVTPLVHRCEASFGFGETGEADALAVGEGADRVLIQGKIDRIDVIDTPEGRLFRVIDYKTGHCPTPTEVKKGLALQLPLYAMAVERLVLNDGSRPMDFGYWSLKESGFSAARGKAPKKGESSGPLASWGRDLDRLERFIGDLLGRLRAGDFPVHPRVGPKECGRVCDFRRVCRIGQVGRARRSWPEQPTVNLDEDDDDQP
jgi:RecB family exonuclease